MTTSVVTEKQLFGYTVVEVLHDGNHSRIYRCKKGEKFYILKTHPAAYCTDVTAKKFKREFVVGYQLSKESSRIVKYLSFEEEVVMRDMEKNYSVAVVQEDYGGLSLLSLIPNGGFSLPQFFNIAVQCAHGLRDIHRLDTIHRDIKPANLVMNPESGEVRFIDFGNSSRLREVTESASTSPHRLCGTMSYLSPEQTGRMNRSIDYRTDFYSLGITFYQLLTNELPFTSSDVMELIHCHIAVEPPALPNSIPQVLQQIVFKLLKKDAQERYQSCRGLMYDLQKCQSTMVQTTNDRYEIPLFEIATRDFSEKLTIPKRLYGRQEELRILLDTFQRVVTHGCSELLLVSGYSGVGKSALVRELHRPISFRHGYFLLGKFDQLERNIAYSALVYAFETLIRQILGETESRIENARKRITEALGANAQLIVDIIPDLGLLIGEQPPVVEVGPTESKTRFDMTFRKFVASFVSAEHPLVIFMDDLQWADRESVELIKSVLEDSKDALLIVGAYRDNEVSETHYVKRVINEIKQKEQVRVTELSLRPLEIGTVYNWLSDTFNRNSDANIQPVTDLLYKKTEGNPFFLAMFLRALHDEGLVRLSSDGSQWDFDLPAIAKRPATENVIEFTVSRMSQFDNDVLSILKWCSCLGNSFNLSKLQFVTKRSHEDLMETLFPLLNHGLVSVVDNIFRFEHDRVQEAATGLLSEEDKHRTHFQIGMTMLEGLLKADTVLDADTEVKMDDFACEAQEVCEIAEQLNAARTIVVAEAPHLIVFLFRMNILLGKRAIDTVAYSSAVTSLLHAEFFFSQLGEKEGWKKYHNTAFELFKSQAAVYAMRAEYELSDAVMDKILNHEPTLAERGIIYNMKIMKETQLFRLEEALAIGVIALGYFGISLPTDPKESDLLVEQEMEKIEKRMVELRGPHPNPNSDFSYLTDETLYEPTTPENRTLQPLLATLQLTTYLSDAVRFKLVTAINCNLCLRVKPIAELSTAFCFLAVRMATEKKYLTALEFKNIAYYLVNVVYPKNLAIRCQALHLGSIFIDFWFNHVRDSEMAEQQAHDFGIESGEIPYAGYTYSYLVPSMEYRGDTIPQMLPEISRCYRFTVDTQNVGVRGHIEAVRLMLHYFIGSDYEHHESIGVIEQEYMEKWALASNYYALAHWSVRKLQFEFTTKYIYLDPKEIENVEEFVASQLSRLADCENQLQYIMSHYANTIFYLYDTLLCIRLLRLLQSTPDTQNLSGTCLDRIENGMSSFEIWSKNNPINFSNKYFLLKAEYTYYIENHHWKAINYYDDSLKAASDSGFLHEYALTKELTSILFIKEDKPSIAKTYIKKAYMAYRKWGATLKLEILQDKYYDYLESLIAKGSPNTPGRTTNSTTLTTVSNFNSDRNRSKSSNTSSTVNVQLALLDMESVVRANQIISSTIDMDELLFNIMRVIIETAGATSGAIITENEVVAQYKKVDNTTEDSQKQTTVAPNHIITNISIPLRNWKDGCIPVVQYVTKTLSTVVMGNAMKDDEYAFIQADEYVFKNQVKSLLCMPVMHQNELKAILYVENSLATDCFTSERVNVLAILTSQMAISIQNSRSFKEQLKIQQVAEFQRGRAQEADLYRQKQEEFIDRICHEIRNPIQGIMGNCDMMRVNMDELKQLVHQQSYQECIEKLDSLDSFVEAVVICAKYQKVITDDVLTLSKLEFGKVALNALAFSPIALLDSLMHMFEAEIHKKKLTLEKIIDCKEDVVLSGDTMRISQILINLLSNSIKFTSTGGIKVYMDYSLIKDEAQVTVPELKFTVEDSGCGMDEQDTAHLFNRFEQAQRTQSEYGGSGLGLFICKQLVLLMGGQIYVESVKGMGSRFTFTVKCSTPDEKQLREFLNGKSNTPVGEDGEKFLRTIDVNGVRPLNVLVVEDNKINHRVLVSMLQKAGCNCAGAYNGVEGLSMYKEQSFDLVFMDVTMPQMNGYECTSAIREYELEMGLPETPIIGLSGNVRTEYMNMGLEAGMTAYMNKPVKYTEILQKVEQCKRK